MGIKRNNLVAFNSKWMDEQNGGFWSSGKIFFNKKSKMF